MAKILESADAYPDVKTIEVNYWDLDFFDSEFAEYLLIKPFNSIYNSEKAILNLLPADIVDKGVKLHVRIIKLPDETARIGIRYLRAEHLGKFVAIEGLVRKATEVRPMLREAVFQCLRCYAIQKVPQESTVFKEPMECSKEQGGCGRAAASTAFKLLTEKSEFIDTQKLEIQESPEGLRAGAQPERLIMYIEDDITGQISPGDRIIVNGILRSQQRITRMRGKSTLFDIYLEGNSIELEEKEFEDVKIDEKEMEKIHELSKKPEVYDTIINSIAPSIYGMGIEKEALALQLFSGVTKHMPDETQIRGDIHILLVGDPGTAKSQLLEYISHLSPRGVYASGKSTSAAGLTAAAVRDEFGEGRWTLEAGALVLADGGIACVHPESNIIVNDKIRMIKSLFDGGKSQIVRTKNGEAIEIVQLNEQVTAINSYRLEPIKTITNLIRRKRFKGEILELNLESGFKIRLTSNHRLIDGNLLSWKPAGKFQVGEYVLCPLKLPKNNEDIYIFDLIPSNWLVILDKNKKKKIKSMVLKRYDTLAKFNNKYNLKKDILSGKSQIKMGTLKQILTDFGCLSEWKCKNLKFARKSSGEKLKISKITPELSYFMGFIYGDGHIKITERRSNIQISQSHVHYGQIVQLKSTFKSFSNKELNEYKRISKSEIRGSQTKSSNPIFYTNSNLLAHISKHFICNDLLNILQLNDDCLKAFIAGALDSDGCVGIKKARKAEDRYQSVHIEFLLSNNDLANKNFMLALRRLGCYSKLIKEKNVSIIRITGRNDSIKLLKQLKRYSVKIKNVPIRKRNISSTSEKAPLQPTKKICEKISKLHTPFLQKTGIWSTLYDYKKCKRQPSKLQLLKIKNRLGKKLVNPLSDEIDILGSSDYFLDKIININKMEYNGDVYDLFVPKWHNFTCDGIIVHNCIDEIDKMSSQDRSALHEAMEQQEIHVAKAGITAALKSRCALLAAANPKYGRFDEYRPISDQIDMPPALLSRFDVIFPVKDKPDKTADMSMAEHILRSHLGGEIKEHRTISDAPKFSKGDEESVLKSVTPTLEPEFLRKYIAFARRNIYPVMTKEAIQELAEFYVHLRVQEGAGETTAVAITPRQLEALVRIAEASARMRLSEEVTGEDTERAIKIAQYFLKRVASDSGILDIDMIATGVGHTQRGRIIELMEIIRTISESDKSGAADEDEVIAEGESRGYEREQLKADIGKLLREGRIFKPTEKKIRIV